MEDGGSTVMQCPHLPLLSIFPLHLLMSPPSSFPCWRLPVSSLGWQVQCREISQPFQRSAPQASESPQALHDPQDEVVAVVAPQALDIRVLLYSPTK